jgi:hypothetical protein
MIESAKSGRDTRKCGHDTTRSSEGDVIVVVRKCCKCDLDFDVNRDEEGGRRERKQLQETLEEAKDSREEATE